MNIFSNVGITELVVILLLALLVFGPERLPEMGRKLGKVLRDVRTAYENLTQDLGPELMSLQQTTKEIRESVQSVRSIPQDVVQSVVKAAELEETIGELKTVTDSVEQMGQTISDAGKAIKSPVSAAVTAARDSLMPVESGQVAEAEAKGTEKEVGGTDDTPGEQAHE
jgi:Tat protein translocase TatB subunit